MTSSRNADGFKVTRLVVCVHVRVCVGVGVIVRERERQRERENLKFGIKQKTQKVYFCAFYCQIAGKEEKEKFLSLLA